LEERTRATLLSAAASVGINGAVVLQTTSGKEPHVLAAVHVDGTWITTDPSDPTMLFGHKRLADNETWFMVQDDLAMDAVAAPGSLAPLMPVYLPTWTRSALVLLLAGAVLCAAFWYFGSVAKNHQPRITKRRVRRKIKPCLSG
jgi:hypothetical protein